MASAECKTTIERNPERNPEPKQPSPPALKISLDATESTLSSTKSAQSPTTPTAPTSPSGELEFSSLQIDNCEQLAERIMKFVAECARTSSDVPAAPPAATGILSVLMPIATVSVDRDDLDNCKENLRLITRALEAYPKAIGGSNVSVCRSIARAQTLLVSSDEVNAFVEACCIVRFMEPNWSIHPQLQCMMFDAFAAFEESFCICKIDPRRDNGPWDEAEMPTSWRDVQVLLESKITTDEQIKFRLLVGLLVSMAYRKVAPQPLWIKLGLTLLQPSAEWEFVDPCPKSSIEWTSGNLFENLFEVTASATAAGSTPLSPTSATASPTASPKPSTPATTSATASPKPSTPATTSATASPKPSTPATTSATASPKLSTPATTSATASPKPPTSATASPRPNVTSVASDFVVHFADPKKCAEDGCVSCSCALDELVGFPV